MVLGPTGKSPYLVLSALQLQGSSALRHVQARVQNTPLLKNLDPLANTTHPRGLYGIPTRA